MNPQQLFPYFLLTSSTLLLIATPCLSQQVNVPIKDIPRLNEIDLPQKSVQKLVQAPTPDASPTSEVVQEIKGIRLELINQGLEVILETTSPEKLQAVNRSEGNNFIVDVSNAQLRLPNDDSIRQLNPVPGITSITVTNLNANTIRIMASGEASVPKVELFENDKSLIFSIRPVGSSTQAQQPPETPQDQPSSSSTPAQQPPDVPQDQPSAEEEEAIEILVTGDQDGYFVPEATAGTRTDTPLRDIPQTVQIIPREVLEDRQVNRLTDALRNVTGIAPSGQTRGPFESFTIRGFDVTATGSIFIDGLFSGFGTRIPTETINLERIEVLKGPASVLFGQGNPGGIVNLVTKKPLLSPFYAAELSIGSFNFYRGSADLTGPLNADKTIAYRLTTAYESSGSFVDFFETRRFFVSPVLSWAITPNTTLSVPVEINRVDVPVDRGLPAVGTVLNNPNGDIPISRNIAEPDMSFSERNVTRLGYTLEHKFNENWSLRNAFRYTAFSTDQDSFSATELEPDGRTLNRIFITGESEENDFIFTTEVIGNFRTGPLKHKLIIGTDLYRQDIFKNEFEGFDFTPIDIFAPVYNGSRGDLIFSGDDRTLTNFIGVFIQDQIEIFSNLKLVIGGRWDYVEQTFEDFLGGTEDFQSDFAFSPRVGIIYQPIQPVSLYASFTRSFNPVIGEGFDGELFEPERGTQYEIGIKTDLRDNLFATLSLFQITRSNVLTTDPDNPDFSIQTGEQRSRGVELSVVGEILSGWKIFAGYSYIDARITEDEDLEEGNILNNVPTNSLSLWTTYEIQSGIAKGLGFGFGLFFVGEREGDLSNTFSLPSYVRTDASIFYNRQNFQATIGFKNLFDEEFFESAESDLRVFPGEPFTVIGTLSFTF